MPRLRCRLKRRSFRGYDRGGNFDGACMRGLQASESATGHENRRRHHPTHEKDSKGPGHASFVTFTAHFL